jgi:hypothetical protein
VSEVRAAPLVVRALPDAAGPSLARPEAGGAEVAPAAPIAAGRPAPPLEELVERLRWRPLSTPGWRAAARTVARGLDDRALETLWRCTESPELPEPELLAACEVLRERQVLREARAGLLGDVAQQRLWVRLDAAEQDPALASLAACSLAALGGPPASQRLLGLARGGAGAAAAAAREALADSTEGFVAEALVQDGGDEELALLERQALGSRWAIDGVTRFLVADRASALALDASGSLVLRRRALLVAHAWEERTGLELALELLSDVGQPGELVDAAASVLVSAASGDLSPVETLLLEADDLERATSLAAALAANARRANGWSRSVASRALCRAAESAGDAHARRSALLALGSLADETSLVSIESVLRSEQDATVRGACIVALSKWPASDAVARLIREAAQNDPSPSVRALAENAAQVGGAAPR